MFVFLVAGTGQSPEGGRFNGFRPEHDVHNLKAPANYPGTAKQPLGLFRACVGGHVKVFGAHAQQQIAHGTAHNECLVAFALQGFTHTNGVVAQ